MQSAFDPLNMISIHALVKRATVCTISVVSYIWHFNPRPREEGNDRLYRACRYTPYFNPRPREEGDTSLKQIGLRFGYFNPRPREEGDIRHR